MQLSNQQHRWFSKKIFWQLNVALGIVFCAVFVLNKTVPHYLMFLLQHGLSNVAVPLSLDSGYEVFRMMLLLAGLALFIALRYGRLAAKFKISSATLYVLLAANASILLIEIYNAVLHYSSIGYQLSAYGLSGLLSIITSTFLEIGSVSFILSQLWHHVIKPHPKLKAIMVTLLQPNPSDTNNVQSPKVGKALVIILLTGLMLIGLSLYKKEITKYMRMEKEVLLTTQIPSDSSTQFSIANWHKAVELTQPALTAEKIKDWQLAIVEWTKLHNEHPYEIEVLEHRAEVYKKIGDVKNARLDLKEATNLGSIDADTWINYCWLTLSSNQTSNAVSICAKSQHINPWSYSSSLNLGHAYLLDDDLRQANFWYDKAIKQINNDEDLQNILNDFNTIKTIKAPTSLIDKLQSKLEMKGHAWLNTLEPSNALLKQAKDAETAGKYNKALSLYQQHIAVIQNLFGHQSSQTVPDLTNLTLLQTDLRQFKEAEANFNLLEKLVANDLGEQDAKMSDVLNDYGYMLYSAGRYVEAINVYQKSIKITKITYGENSPKMASRLHGLGSAYRMSGQLDNAYRSLNDAMEISLHRLMPNYEYLARRVSSLGLLNEEVGNNLSANYYLTQALEMTELSVGTDHIGVCQRLHDLGNLMVKENRYQEAEQIFRRALKIAENSPTPKSKIKTNAILDLAELLTLTGNKEEANQLYNRIKIFEQSSKNSLYLEEQ
jgi:tetratricopeptide (TPR) repeat protein